MYKKRKVFEVIPRMGEIVIWKLSNICKGNLPAKAEGSKKFKKRNKLSLNYLLKKIEKIKIYYLYKYSIFNFFML